MGIEEKILKYIPTVKKPAFRIPLNSKLFWTGLVLITYLILTHIRVFGLAQNPAISSQLRFFELVLGARIGSVMTLGIGPIVTAGIMLQLLVGSKILDWDLTKEEYRKKFQSWNKILAILFCFLEGFAFTLSRFVPVQANIGSITIVSLQFALGGILVIFLDEVVSKWGIGSGVSLFIAAGVSSQIFNSIFSPLLLPSPGALNPGPYVGNLWNFLYHVSNNNVNEMLRSLIPILSTLIVILIVSYAAKISVELPLSFGALRGFSRTWSLKLFYTSNIPVILAAALITNLTIMASLFATDIYPEKKCGILGCLDFSNNPIDGFIYYVSSPRTILLADIISGTITEKEIIRGITYILFLSVVATIFSVLWVATTSMDPKSMAKQLTSMNLRIPGFRSSEMVVESVLNKYVPRLAIMGGFLIGFLAGVADVIGAIGTGTGILLTMLIIENFYELLKRERMEEAHPLIRRFVE